MKKEEKRLCYIDRNMKLERKVKLENHNINEPVTKATYNQINTNIHIVFSINTLIHIISLL